MVALPATGDPKLRQGGKLITASGKEVFSGAHYHSYRKDSLGTTKIIISSKNGPDLKTDKFSIHTEVDSGD